MDMYVDLHTHSNHSDGTDSPAEVISKAKHAGLSAVALTDHDTTSGLDEFIKSGLLHGIETVPGIEICTKMLDIEVHLLGYFIDHENEIMKSFLVKQTVSRLDKNRKTFERLQALGFDVDLTDFTESRGIITRGSIAAVMCRKGFAENREEVFAKYLGEGKPAFVDRERVPVEEAVRLILACGGIPVMAHPYMYDVDDGDFEREIAVLANAGLCGIEVLYPKQYSAERETFFRGLAAKNSLLITGGSDYHGGNKPARLGLVQNNEHVPYELLAAIKGRL